MVPSNQWTKKRRWWQPRSAGWLLWRTGQGWWYLPRHWLAESWWVLGPSHMRWWSCIWERGLLGRSDDALSFLKAKLDEWPCSPELMNQLGTLYTCQVYHSMGASTASESVLCFHSLLGGWTEQSLSVKQMYTYNEQKRMCTQTLYLYCLSIKGGA